MTPVRTYYKVRRTGVLSLTMVSLFAYHYAQAI